MTYQNMTMEELQKLDIDDLAMAELGRRVVDFEIHQHWHMWHRGGDYFCSRVNELEQELANMENDPNLPEDYEQIFDAGVQVGLNDAICLNT